MSVHVVCKGNQIKDIITFNITHVDMHNN